MPFITGSQHYGNAKEDSDVDLVIYVDEITKEHLITMSDDESLPCKFGRLNLIFATTPEEYAAWVVGRRLSSRLVNKTKREIVRQHEFAREMLGVFPDHDVHYSGDDK